MTNTKNNRPWTVVCYSVHEKKVEKAANSRIEDSARYLLKQMAEDSVKKIQKEYDGAVILDINESYSRATVSWDDDKMLTFDIANTKRDNIKLRKKSDPRQRGGNSKHSNKKSGRYNRICKVDIATVRKMYDDYKNSGDAIQLISYYDDKKNSVEIVEVDMSDDRYDNFFEHGMVCVKCGLRGEYFWLETMGYGKKSKYSKPHFNLYGMINGMEMQLTRDHIFPKSKGGKDSLDNYQTMCRDCNVQKGNSV